MLEISNFSKANDSFPKITNSSNSKGNSNPADIEVYYDNQLFTKIKFSHKPSFT